MDLLAAFTGKPAKEAAAQNQMRLAQLKTEGMGQLDTGRTGALGALESAKGYYDPLKSLGEKYGAGSSLYMDSLGVNGPAGNANAVNAFQAGPGYQWGVDQSLDALDRRASSRGMLASGNNTIDTLGTVHGLANREYGGWQDRLGGLINPELSATGASATGLAGLEAGKSPVWTNDANQRVNLSSGVTRGINDQSTQSANAEIAGSGNILKAGMGLASLAAGGLGGFGGLAGLGLGGMTSVPGAAGGLLGGTIYNGNPTMPGFGPFRG